jgi:site-specific DNA-methyltransferase (adenine-specific)
MNDIFNDNVSLKTETPAFAKHVLPAVPSSEVYLEDCVTALKRYADNHFDLAIVDPPYGIDKLLYRSSYGNCAGSLTKYSENRWDKEVPTDEYFAELMRVSKNQIIWGGNYFKLPPTRGVLCWDKQKHVPNFSAWEMAWTSFDCVAKIFRKLNIDPKRIHPTQKPTSLYDWLLKEFAKQGDLILDTHLGSGSSRIAAYKGGFNFVGFEIDQEYYEKQEKRFNDFKSQLRLF